MPDGVLIFDWFLNAPLKGIQDLVKHLFYGAFLQKGKKTSIIDIW